MFFKNITTFISFLSDQTGKKINKVDDSGSKHCYNTSLNLFPFYFLLEKRIMLDADFSSLVQDQILADADLPILDQDKLLEIKSLSLDKTLSFYQSYAQKFEKSNNKDISSVDKSSDIINNYLAFLEYNSKQTKTDLLVIFEDQQKQLYNIQSRSESLQIIVLKENNSDEDDNDYYSKQFDRSKNKFRSVHILKDNRISSYDFLVELLENPTGQVFIYKNSLDNSIDTSNLIEHDEELVTKQLKLKISKQSINFYEKIVATNKEKSQKIYKNYLALPTNSDILPNSDSRFDTSLRDRNFGVLESTEDSVDQQKKEAGAWRVEYNLEQKIDNKFINTGNKKNNADSTYFPLHYSIHYNWADIINNKSKGHNLVYGNYPLPITGTQMLEDCFGPDPDNPTPPPPPPPPTPDPVVERYLDASPYFLDISDLLKQIDSDFLHGIYASLDGNDRAPLKTYISAKNLERIGSSLSPNKNQNDITGLGVNFQEMHLGNLQDKLNLIIFNNNQDSNNNNYTHLQDILNLTTKNSSDLDYFINQNDYKSKAAIKPVDNLLGKKLSNKSRMIYLNDYKPSYRTDIKSDRIKSDTVNKYIQAVEIHSSLSKSSSPYIAKLPYDSNSKVVALNDVEEEKFKDVQKFDDSPKLIPKDDSNLDKLSKLIIWLKGEGINQEILNSLVANLLVDNNRAQVFDILENILINKKGQKILIEHNNNQLIKNLLQN